MTLRELREKAKADLEQMRGRIIKITAAQVGDGSDTEMVEFLDPVEVRIDDMPMQDNDILEDHFPDLELIDTYYGVEPVDDEAFQKAVLAAKLQCLDQDEKFHISWIDGPTYFLDGRKEWEYVTDTGRKSA